MSAPRRPRVLIADDHLMVAEALKSLLSPDFDLVGVVEDGRMLIEAAETLRPNVIVADITMPHLNGIDALIRLRQGGSQVPVVFLTMHRDVSLSPQITADVLETLKQRPERSDDPLASITSRQREVLQLLAEGHAAKTIAVELSISARTVEFHKYQMMETLGIQTKTELIHFAIKHGLVVL